MSSTNPDDRAALIDGLLSLACFLEAHPDVPVPSVWGGPTIHVFPAGDSDDERRAAVDRAAAALGTAAGESGPGSGHYRADRAFGPVVYRVLTISEAAHRLSAAQHSYEDSIRVDDDTPVAA